MEEKEISENPAPESNDQESNKLASEKDSTDAPETSIDLSEEIDHYKSIAQRAQADLVNYRSRASQEIEEAKRAVQFGVISRFISIVDDLERAVENAPEEAQIEWREGVELVLRNLEKALELEGVSQIDSLGKSFDPREHEALLYEENSDTEDGLILNVIQQGYRLNERIIRPARVIVSKFTGQENQEDELSKQEEK
ncbi:MAG: nucleotide exchange factor GrpE [SAR202 cluster bacterium]|nr:nucleotide exchange factor GrpE [SAR202 cluster bacterium]